MKKSQGEIFGIAIMFVIIVVAILIYAQIESLNPTRDENSFSKSQNQILAQGVLQTVMEVSTTCEVEKGKNSLENLFNYCLKHSNLITKPECQNPCEKAINYLNNSLKNIFEKETIGKKLYLLEVDREVESPTDNLRDINLTNAKTSDLEKYSKAPASYKITTKRGVEFRLFILYK